MVYKGLFASMPCCLRLPQHHYASLIRLAQRQIFSLQTSLEPGCLKFRCRQGRRTKAYWTQI